MIYLLRGGKDLTVPINVMNNWWNLGILAHLSTYEYDAYVLRGVILIFIRYYFIYKKIHMHGRKFVRYVLLLFVSVYSK